MRNINIIIMISSVELVNLRIPCILNVKFFSSMRYKILAHLVL